MDGGEVDRGDHLWRRADADPPGGELYGQCDHHEQRQFDADLQHDERAVFLGEWRDVQLNRGGDLHGQSERC